MAATRQFSLSAPRATSTKQELLMKKVNWTIKAGKKIVATGTTTAETDRDALTKVLQKEHGFEPKEDEAYRVTVGDLTTTSYGDEFERVSRMAQCGHDPELEDKENGYHFTDKKKPPFTVEEWVEDFRKAVKGIMIPKEEP